MKKEKDYAKLLRYICLVLLLVIVFITILQVFYRFVLDSPLIWTDELSRFLLIWMVFLGAATVSFDDKHLAVNVLQENMSSRMQLISNLVIRTLIIIFLAMVIYTSIDIVSAAHYNRSGALDIPFSYWRVSITVGSVLMIGYTVLRSVLDIRAYQAGEYNNDSSEGEMET
ncbi:TRAP-type C4-dicarboxylate transport system, small permease component [Lentibacillus halodurans]|uniref:TRAP-type C4-dicarboxylate transport system, small permease component n=1 Tax=Lentibacillus halodurans TaxID=237679 RepID=A0A1I0WYT3_9BACI|nr:TRAP transporter small permease [Lentibacillus halodurans]SFA93942.1 TRAP-type C4-dicarboxylate transport system, small permease component [Lentibacillus halodurans]